MKADSPPGRKAGRLVLRPDRHLEKKTNNQRLRNSPAVVNDNRELLDRLGRVSLFKISRGRFTRYEVEHGASRWSFNLLFSAQGKFERLASARKKEVS